MIRQELLILLIAYLLGSIPFGYILVRCTEDKDIRSLGSGNIGATNVFRTNRINGLLTYLLDAGKGYMAVLIAGWLGGSLGWQAAAAFVAIFGHIFTVWLGFKGGKGVSTGCGAFLALSPAAVLTTLVVFVAILTLTRYMSAAALLATALFPVWAFLYGKPAPILLWGSLGALLIVVRHHQNIKRLISGTESKFALERRS
jgi:acyl phosphate:glycerol-3-phosphate acyltransferase